MAPNHTIPPQGYSINYHDPIKSFAPVTIMGNQPLLLIANPSVPANNLKDLVALAKSKPGVINFAADGPSTLPFLTMEMLMQRTGISMVPITYQGGGPAQTALLGGEVQLFFGTIIVSGEQVKSAASSRPLPSAPSPATAAMPEIPTVAEAADLPGFRADVWNAVLAPAGTPKDIVAKIHDDIVTVMAMLDIKKARSPTRRSRRSDRYARGSLVNFLKADLSSNRTGGGQNHSRSRNDRVRDRDKLLLVAEKVGALLEIARRDHRHRGIPGRRADFGGACWRCLVPRSHIFLAAPSSTPRWHAVPCFGIRRCRDGGHQRGASEPLCAVAGAHGNASASRRIGAWRKTGAAAGPTRQQLWRSAGP